jgi:hypothetical protein
MYQNSIADQVESTIKPIKSTPEVETPVKTCDEKRIERFKFKYEKAKQMLSHSEGHLQNVSCRMDLCYQAQVKAEEELRLAEFKYKKCKRESKDICRELRGMRDIVRQNKARQSDALDHYNSAIKEKYMKLQVKIFNTSQDLEKLEGSRENVSLNLELLRSKVPDEVLKIIASYIPYKTRIEMIEHFHKPENYLRCVSSERLDNLLYNMRYASYYCLTGVLASPNETKLLKSNKNTLISHTFRKEESIVKIKFILMILKKRDPESALRVLKTFAVLNQANTANKCKHKNTIFAFSFKQDMEFMTHAY